jgi:pSer/pThr/pTyr-binding forkhead associated (FHA) protein
MYKLELKLQSLTLKEYALASGAKLAIGRHPASEIVLDDMAVSRHHATVEVQGQKLLVFDQRSKNGIIVNGKKVQSAWRHCQDWQEVYHRSLGSPTKEKRSNVNW